MKYFFDTEFIEGSQNEWFPLSLFKKHTKPTIDLISIGIVTEDNREYYAVSKDFNIKEAWERFDVAEAYGDDRLNYATIKVYWIRYNVLKPIWRELFFNADMEYSMLSNKQSINFLEAINRGEYDKYFTLKSLQHLIEKYGKSNSVIADEIKKFVYLTSTINDPECIANWNDVKHLFPVEFYAYYADYDWVVFCWLFGKMKNLPKGFPMYCRDLKQIFDEKEDLLRLPPPNHQHIDLKAHSHYPKQETEHNALDDAKWNKKLYEFIKKLNNGKAITA